MPREKKKTRTSHASSSRTTRGYVDPEATVLELGLTLPQGSLEASPASPRYDTTRFRSYEVSNLFIKNYAPRNIILERRVDFADYAKSHPRIVDVFAHQRLTEMLSTEDEVSATFGLRVLREHAQLPGWHLHDHASGEGDQCYSRSHSRAHPHPQGRILVIPMARRAHSAHSEIVAVLGTEQT
ncbi:hypothetical protein SLA2020_433300 [Shorea laevis]